MKEIIIFLLGAAVGASVALLLAPESGEELRADIQARAQEELPKLQSEWQSAMEKTNQRLNKLETDLKQSLDKS
jgi:gas vesicle protein